jgi:hypothetical protein
MLGKVSDTGNEKQKKGSVLICNKNHADSAARCSVLKTNKLRRIRVKIPNTS